MNLKAKNKDPELKPAVDEVLLLLNTKSGVRQEMMALLNACEVLKPSVGVLVMDVAIIMGVTMLINY
ncbi:hypothetical protein RMB13_00270 [Acinetobacter sp. V102_4]|uniref:hypothetical protein n=1 Tax=Acinetobacter sp. V102_4 TaxID=3072984 RepID=UPI00287D709E|nr:hypothetical protein [Acinetobacter sp. V102_4]MDS7927935.1 hypothetical protein [Acinetobacter sp. V102_4]